jgi:RHS repeat-associated protein
MNGATTANYTYNGNGQRVKKVVGGTTTVFHYSLSGQLIAESDSSGNVTAEYVYLNGQPLAKIEGANTYYYHNDYLGSPQKITKSDGSVVWSADYKPFGEASITASDNFTNNLRFPGQYYDVETGLNYNYYRDYNPVLGRYIEADPIGLGDGDNLIYTYTANNPINAFDFYGLCLCEISEKQGKQATATAANWAAAGVPYKTGCNTKKGADCSGAMAGIFREIGLEFVDVSAGDITNSAYYKKETNCRAGDVVVWLSKPYNHVVLYDPYAGGQDPWGKPADSWGANGANVTSRYGPSGNVPFSKASIPSIDKSKKAPHTCYRRLTDCKNVK